MVMNSYLFVTFPMRGHVDPMVPVVTELVDRGARVEVIAGPDFVDTFRPTGARIRETEIPVLGSVPEKLDRSGRASRRRANAEVRRRRARLADDLCALWPQLRPDVVVTDLYAEWGATAARRNGTPLASFTGTYAVNERMAVDGIRRAAGPIVTTLLRASRLIRIVHPALRDRAELVLANATDELQPSRAEFGDRYRFVGPLLREDSISDPSLPWQRMADGPLLYVSSGTVYQRGATFYQHLATAFADTEWTVVMATGRTDPAEIGPLPENVHARQFVPQHQVLACSDVFVTHGGMNSVLDAVRCEVPMLAAPCSLDQRGTAEQLEKLGIGEILGRTVALDGVLAAANRLAADQEVKSRLRTLAAPTTAGSAGARAADALEEFAVRRARPHAAR